MIAVIIVSVASLLLFWLGYAAGRDDQRAEDDLKKRLDGL